MLTLDVMKTEINSYGLVEIEFSFKLETKVGLETINFEDYLEVEISGK